MTRAVLFDVDGTLYRQPLLQALMAVELAGASAASCSVAHATSLLRTLSTFRRVREELRSCGDSSSGLNTLQFVVTAARLSMDEERVREIVEEWIFERPLKHLRRTRRPGVRQMLGQLTERGLLVGALSDYPGSDKLTALGVIDRFSLVLCTTDADINAFKPHPKGFLRACEMWDLAPQEVLYVGDRPEVDAVGAAAAGLRSVIIGRRGAGDDGSARYASVGSFGELSRALAA